MLMCDSQARWFGVSERYVALTHAYSSPTEPVVPRGEQSYIVISGSRDNTVKVWHVPLAVPSAAMDNLNLERPTTRGAVTDTYSILNPAPTQPLDAHVMGDDNSEDAGPVDIVDGKSNEDSACILTFSGHQASVRSVAAGGRTVVSGSYDAFVRVWDLLTGLCVHRLVGHQDKVYIVSYDDSTNRIASGSLDNTIRIWNSLTGHCHHILEDHTSLVGLLQLESLPYMPESIPAWYARPRATPLSPGSTSLRTPLPPPSQNLSRSSFFAEDSYTCYRPPQQPKVPVLISAAADHTLKVWDPATGRCHNTLYGHQAAITCFQFDRDKIISGSDGSIKLWDLRHNGGTFVRDVVTNITNAWRVAMDDRRLVVAVQRNQSTWFEVIDFDVSGAP